MYNVGILVCMHSASSERTLVNNYTQAKEAQGKRRAPSIPKQSLPLRRYVRRAYEGCLKVEPIGPNLMLE